jgi:hypothetical protein
MDLHGFAWRYMEMGCLQTIEPLPRANPSFHIFRDMLTLHSKLQDEIAAMVNDLTGAQLMP